MTQVTTKDGAVIVLSTEDLPGPYEIVGIVHGAHIRANPITHDIWQTIKNIFGGELVQYGVLIDRTIDRAMENMVQKAAALQANGIVGIKLSTSNVVMGGAEVIAYGTAVRFLDEVPALGDPSVRATQSATPQTLAAKALSESGGMLGFRKS